MDPIISMDPMEVFLSLEVLYPADGLLVPQYEKKQQNR